jgi:hypothetical protein
LRRVKSSDARSHSTTSSSCAGISQKAYASNLVQFHVHQPTLASTPGERPRVSALARRQASTGDRVTTLHHETLRIDDVVGRRLLTLLDGTRDRAAILRSMSQDGEGRRSQAAKLDSRLDRLARLALLEE